MRERKGQRGRGLTHSRSYTNTELNSGSAERTKNKERDKVLKSPFSSRFDLTALEDTEIPVFGTLQTPDAKFNSQQNLHVLQCIVSKYGTINLYH